MPRREIIFTELQPTLAEFKSHIRVTSSDLDGELSLKLQAAIQRAERYVGMTIARSRFTLSSKFSTVIAIESYPLNAVDSVAVDGITVPVGNYTVDGQSLVFKEGITGKAVEIVYTAGLEQVPFDMKAAILLDAAKLFNNPVDTVETLAKTSENLLRPFRTWGQERGK